VDVSSLKTIESMYSDSKDCLREVITEWLKAARPKPTWRSLVDALRRPVVNEANLAAELEAKNTAHALQKDKVTTLFYLGIYYRSCNIFVHHGNTRR